MQKKFIITGASGYLGREIVNSILTTDERIMNESTKIICLVRESRVESEKKYWQSKECIQVMTYDMLDGGETVEKALATVSSCESGHEECCIFHVASIFSPTDNHEQMAMDNVQGTVDLMNAVAKFPSINSRVILTSSMAGVRGTGQTPLNGLHYTEKDWNTVSRLGANWGSSYQWSKVMSEQKAWDIAKTNGIKFTSLCPSFIFGPPLSAEASQSFSILMMSKWMNGESPVQSRLCVDVRDVARAHVIAATRPETIGERIIVSTESRLSSIQMADELRRMATQLGIGKPEKIHADVNFDGGAIKIGCKEVDCASRMEELLDGFTVRPVEESMRDMAKALLLNCKVDLSTP
jgi:nucleoside-diphosphate-sugar epimerase